MHVYRRLTIIGVTIGVLLSAAPAPAADGNTVTQWNAVATTAVLNNPGRILDSRALAAVHAAIHDALNAIERRYRPYALDISMPGASVDAAVATAAHHVLIKLSTAPNVQPAYDAALSQIAEGPAKASGVTLGALCADAILARLATDGAADANLPVYITTGQPGDYDRTPFNAPTPPGVVGLFPGWGRVQPWGIELAEHEVSGPVPLASLAYTLDFNYLKAIGGVTTAAGEPPRTDRDRALLGRRRSCGVEPHCEHTDPTEGTESVEGRPHLRACELCECGQLYCQLPGQVQDSGSGGRRRRLRGRTKMATR